ncbi:MAG: HlyD family secretion protein, partial [Lysobacterales bacterium]
IRIFALISLLIFIWYLVADRTTPYTSNARLKAIVVDVVPQVSGYVSALAATNGQVVKAGDLMARIDQRPFVLEVEQARSALQTATQNVGAGSAQVQIAQASVTQARINLDNTQVQSARYFELEKKKVVSTAEADTMRAKLAAAQSQLVGANADLERARQQLGDEGADNAQIRAAIAALGEAELHLEWTELFAPAPGTAIDLQVAEGTYAKAGQSLMSFVSFEEVWVEAYLTENNIARISVGDPAEITLDLYPGRIFKGVVSSFSIGASVGVQAAGSLPKPPEIDGWMRDPQRFPVRIRMLGYEIGEASHDTRRMLNGQADVIVYTGDNWLMNNLGKAWIRLMSWLSYAY